MFDEAILCYTNATKSQEENDLTSDHLTLLPPVNVKQTFNLNIYSQPDHVLHYRKLMFNWYAFLS